MKKDEVKSIVEEIYRMDINTLRKYCLDLLKRRKQSQQELIDIIEKFGLISATKRKGWIRLNDVQWLQIKKQQGLK